VFEYAPTDVKLSVAGYGRADKRQVKEMVRHTLTLDRRCELSDDAADALAIALCHLFQAKMTSVKEGS
jgi:crossover junction endodeoxyribonuclease RuvC